MRFQCKDSNAKIIGTHALQNLHVPLKH